MPKRIKAENRPELATRIRALRLLCGLTQEQMAKLCGGVRQSVVARWEEGKFEPPGQALVKMARLAPADERWWWLQKAGLEKSDLIVKQVGEGFVRVAVLKDPVAAGSGRAIDETEIDHYLMFPKEVVGSGTVTGLRVNGTSMWPIIDEGFIVLVDTSQNDPRRLVDSIVAAREGEGVTIKYLRKRDKVFILAPSHPSPSHPPILLGPENDAAIIGKVIKWIGQPN